jgi:hypothetical protein
MPVPQGGKSQFVTLDGEALQELTDASSLRNQRLPHRFKSSHVRRIDGEHDFTFLAGIEFWAAPPQKIPGLVHFQPDPSQPETGGAGLLQPVNRAVAPVVVLPC